MKLLPLCETRLAALRERLLGNGGTEVASVPTECYADEKKQTYMDEVKQFHIEELLEYGKIYPKRGIRRSPETGDLPSNVAYLWFGSRGRTAVVGGFALDANGVWQQHYWGVRDDKVIETTSGKWSHYFGVELHDNSLTAFLDINLDYHSYFRLFERNAALLGFDW